mgnify:CR=1 FL=1
MEFKDIKIKEIITNNFWLKVISLIIAILVWFYVAGTITGGGKSL